ncbi:MAG: AEC family transporter [Dorea sp.]
MDFTKLLNLQIMMFLMMATGVFLRKKNIITLEGKKVLTDLVIDLILPCNIIASFCIEFSPEILKRCGQVFVISCLIEVVCTFLATHIYKKFPKGKRMVLQYGTICSNAGFLGNPLTEGIYGSMGLLYASIYLIPQRIIMWSAGVSFFTESPDKKTLVKKVVTHPCIVACMIGIIVMGLQITLPDFLFDTINNIGKCTTAITMILIGAILSEADLKTMVTKTTAAFSLLRLIIIPLMVFAGCLLTRMPMLVTGVSVVLAAMPAGTTTAILAVKYNGDEEFATKCVVLTTLLSMIMVPIWCLVIQAAY